METRRLAEREGDRAEADDVFRSILVGIDDTPESLVAAAQAGVLRPPDGHLTLLAVVERHLAAHAGLGAAHAEDDLLAETERDLERARELVDADEAVLGTGTLVDRLCAECSSRGSTLVAVGFRRHARLSARTFGSDDLAALHRASCSLLIARPGWGPSKPDTVMIALDGSPESRAAEAVGRALARRLGRDALPVIGLGDDIELAILREERDDALLDPGPLVEAVAHASTRATLVVVGHRTDGRHRGRRLAERIVAATQSSILVVQHETVA